MLRIVEHPSRDLVAATEVKELLGLDGNDFDARLKLLIPVATQKVESEVQRRYITQTLDWVLPAWSPVLRLPVAPVASVTSVKYRDQAGVEQTLPTADYVVSPCGETLAIRPAAGAPCWPLLDCDAAEAVTVRFVAGMGVNDFDRKHAAARQAAVLWVKALLWNCDDSEAAAKDLLTDERWS